MNSAQDISRHKAWKTGQTNVVVIDFMHYSYSYNTLGLGAPNYGIVFILCLRKSLK